MDMKQTLISGLPELKLDLTQAQIDTLCAFGQAVIDQNQVMNLTAITEPQQVAKLHLLDSLTVLSALDLRGKSLIDVGCGAGFPGVPLAIAFTCTSLYHRLAFQKAAPIVRIDHTDCLQICVDYRRPNELHAPFL